MRGREGRWRDGSRRGGDGWVRRGQMQENAEPHQGKQHEVVEKKLWHHGNAPPEAYERGTFSRFSGHGNDPQYRHTRPKNVLAPPPVMHVRVSSRHADGQPGLTGLHLADIVGFARLGPRGRTEVVPCVQVGYDRMATHPVYRI